MLLADLIQFLLDSLNDSVRVTSGIVPGISTRGSITLAWGGWNSLALAVPVAIVTLAATRPSRFGYGGNYA